MFYKYKMIMNYFVFENEAFYISLSSDPLKINCFNTL